MNSMVQEPNESWSKNFQKNWIQVKEILWKFTKEKLQAYWSGSFYFAYFKNHIKGNAENVSLTIPNFYRKELEIFLLFSLLALPHYLPNSEDWCYISGQFL